MKGAALLLYLCCLPMVLVPGAIGGPGRAPHPEETFPAGEELVYEVSWWFVKLGTIRLRIVEAGRDTSGVRLRARADIDSYDGLPFASLHVMTETVMDSDCYSTSFIGRTQNGQVWKTIDYNHLKEKNLLLVERGLTTSRTGKASSVDKVDTLSAPRRFQDGVSILYFARANVMSRKKTSVPTVVEGAKGRTSFDFHGKRTSEEIDAVDYPVDVIEFTGTAEFEGIFGLRGPFEGWFSNDDARIPIRANMEVIVGSVKVELTEWHRAGWIPPRSTSGG